MAYGMRIWGGDGRLQLDEKSFTVRIVYSAVINAQTLPGRYLDISIPGVDPATHSAVCIPLQPYSTSAQDIRAIGYTPVVFSGYVRVYFGCPSTSQGPTGLAPQRLLVMRFR